MNAMDNNEGTPDYTKLQGKLQGITESHAYTNSDFASGYILAAGNHDIANGDISPVEDQTSWMEQIARSGGAVAGAWLGVKAGAAAGAAIGGVGAIPGAIAGGVIGAVTGYDWRFTAATAISGVSQAVNSAVELTSFVPGDWVDSRPLDPHDIMANLDDDLNQYYAQHEDAVDAAGFVVGSIVPGMAGIKAYKGAVEGAKMYNRSGSMLQAFSAGKVGYNMEAATGLLGGTQARLLQAATAEMATSGEMFSFMNANLIGSIAAGAGEQAIQAMAFEIGAQVAMNQSPLLANQDFSDIAINVLHAGMLGGAVGGVFEAASTGFKVKSFLGIRDKALRGHEFESGIQAGTPLDEQIIHKYDSQFNLDSTPAPGYEELSAKKQVGTISKLQDNVRQIFQKINGDRDAQIANMFHEEVSLSTNTLQASTLTLGLKDFSRLGELTSIEKELMQAQTSLKKALPITPEQQALLDTHSIKYVKLWGEGAEVGSKVLAEPPKFTSIWDTLKSGQSIKVTANDVRVGTNVYKAELNKIHDIRSINTVAEANARDLWAIHSGPLPDGHLIGEFDPALLRKAYADLGNAETGVSSIRVQHADGSISTLTSAEDALLQLKASVKLAQDEMLVKAVTAQGGQLSSTEAIASALNIKTPYLERTVVNEQNLFSDLHAMQDYAASYAKKVEPVSAKLAEAPSSILLRPQTIKAVYNTGKLDEQMANALPIMTYMKERQVLYRQDADRAAASITGDYHEQLFDIPEGAIREITKAKVGGGTISAANSAYGSTGAMFERIGHVVNKMKTDASNRVISTWDPISYKLLGDTPSATEFAIIQNKIQSMPDRYILDTQSQGLIHRDVARFREEIAAGKTPKDVKRIDPNSPDVIPITNKAAYDTLVEHVRLNDERIPKFNNIRALNSPGHLYEKGTVYFPNPDLNQYPYFALVTDSAITGTGQAKMIYAATPQKLEELIALVPEEFRAGVIKKPNALTGPEMDRWHKAVGEYKRAETMSENYFDAALYRSGSAAPYIPQMDAKLVVDNLKDWHIKQEHLLLREAVALKYAPEFHELRSLADRDINIANAKFQWGKGEKATAKDAMNSDSAYMSYIRTALDIPNGEAIPLRATQDFLDRKISEVWNGINKAFSASTSPADLDKINDMVQAAGIKTISYDVQNMALANHQIPRGALSTFTRRGNAILASIILKPDVLNAVNNMVGSLVLMAPETHSVLEAIKAGNKEAVGELINVAHIVIPDTQHTLLSSAKLMHNAVKMAQDPAMRKWAMDRGLSVRHSQEVSDMVDTLALTGKEYNLDLEGKITLAYDKAMRLGKWAEEKTGNSYAEEMTRLTSALVMKQLTDVAVKHGHMSENLAESYIQTFVNRANGNYLASQRPMMFNGPVGQSVGLFQTYMTNLIQQSLRHVATGGQKSAALMLGLQGTIYGMASLPGFQQINTNLVGMAAGNSDHKDVFSVMYNAMDKNKADWVMYGALSNSLGLIHPDLKLNMYVRGDVNPRNISIIPLNPADYPIATASAKFFGNVYDTMDKLTTQGSGKATTLLQGLEHNGLSRPLSGLAQVMEAFTNPEWKSFSTFNSGSLVSANDLISVMNLARLTGAKPLDDAKAIDESFRQVAYKAKEHDSIQRLGEVIKSSVLANEAPSDEQLHKFQKEYVKLGGKQEGFNKFMANAYKDANVSVSTRLSEKLNSPESIKMQMLMGGRKANDFSKLVEPE
jgi:hypothetical protein